MIIAIPQIFSLEIFRLLRAAGLSASDPFTFPLFLGFFYLVLSPGITFPIVYFWGRKRVKIVSQLKDRYARFPILLFLGSLIGFSGPYLIWIFLSGSMGTIASFPNPSADYFFIVLQSALLAVGYALDLTFIGFTAITLSFFRNERVQFSTTLSP